MRAEIRTTPGHDIDDTPTGHLACGTLVVRPDSNVYTLLRIVTSEGIVVQTLSPSYHHILEITEYAEYEDYEKEQEKERIDL